MMINNNKILIKSRSIRSHLLTTVICGWLTYFIFAACTVTFSVPSFAADYHNTTITTNSLNSGDVISNDASYISGGPAVNATGSGAHINVNGVSVDTANDDGDGVRAGSGGTANVAGSTITTSGNRAWRVCA